MYLKSSIKFSISNMLKTSLALTAALQDIDAILLYLTSTVSPVPIFFKLFIIDVISSVGFNLSKKYGTSSILIELSPKSLILNPAFSKISLFSS